MGNPKKTKQKTNKRTTKMFFKILAGLICLMIVCAATNKIFDALSETAAAAQNNNAAGTEMNNGMADAQNQQYYEAGNSQYNNNFADSNSQGVADSGNSAPVVDPNGGNTAGGNVQNGNTAVNNNAAAQTTTNPLQYNKAQLVNYYNQCLKNTYKQQKFTVTKTEKIDVQLGKLLLDGKQKDGIQSFANDIVKKNTKNETTSKTFTGGNPQVTNERFILPANLVSSGVKDNAYSISKNGAGYVVKFELVTEDCDFRTKPKHNNSCTFPLDFTEIDLGGLGEITSATFHYPGTVLTANIDGQGRVTQTYVVMPLTVKNAAGQGKGIASGFKISVDIAGTWFCTNTFTF